MSVLPAPRRISDLFSPHPPRWGFRGDPHLWNEMQARFVGVTCPESVEQLERTIEAMFEELTGFPMTHRESFQIEKYSHGGMSSGMVSPKFWRETALPLLRSRLEHSPSFKRTPDGTA